MRDCAELCKRLRGVAKLERYYNASGKLFDDAADAIEELLAAAPKWISVKEGLPEKGKPVLVYGKRGGIYTALFEGGKYWWKLNSKSHYCEPTHWMPLPEPPPRSSQATPDDINPAGSAQLHEEGRE